jgi:hypothetical protein
LNAIAFDPLIAEAKQRARRRRLVALGVLVLAAAAIGTSVAFRSTSRANSLGICASPPSGWRERRVAAGRLPAAVLLTSFRFGVMGPMGDIYGIDYPGRKWPPGGVMMAVAIYASHRPDARAELRVAATDFHVSPNGGSKRPTAFRWIRRNGQELAAWVQVASVTPATTAAANHALAGVRTCSV